MTVVLTTGIAAFLPQAAEAGTGSATVGRQTALSATDDPAGDGSLSDEDKALQQAQASGQPAEVVSARTEPSDEWANPDGSFSIRRYGSPVRVFRSGAWVPTDPTLVTDTDGTVVPRASTVAVRFSGGGSGPLLTGIKDGRTLTLSWPDPLPSPTLDGNVATYADVLPGVDLQLKAEVEGFSQLIVVKTAQAADNPRLATLRYTMSTVGLSVATDPDTGSVTASDPAGQTVFTSPTPLMWDSTTQTSEDPPASAASSTASRAAATAQPADAADAPADDPFEPPPGAQDAQMATAVNGDTLSITPDQSLLTGADTRYPVYIDPSFAWGKRQNWTRVYRKYPSTSYWNANEVARVGYENETYGLSRSFFQMDISNIKGAGIISSTFRIKNTWSWSCQDRPVELWQTGPISSKTTWNHQPAKIGSVPVSTVDDAKGWSSACPGGNLEFNVTPTVKAAAAHSNSSITLGMYASNESDTFGWKKFDPKTAVLETTYNHVPDPPSALGTNPKTSCSAGGLIGNTTVSLHATVKDADAGNLTARFQVFPAGSGTAVVNQTVPALNGRVVTLVVPDADLPTGSYTWKVNATDAMNAASGWSQVCAFSVDRTRPAHPPVINSTVFPPGDAGWPPDTGKARQTAGFTLSANGVADAAQYGWYTDYDPEVQYTNVAPGASATVRITPPGYGPHFVYAFSIDAAGNRSDTATYVYYAAGSGVRDNPADVNGDGNDDIWNVDSNGTLLTYAGQGNGRFSAATNGGQTFEDTQTASRGDWGQDGYNDLVTLEPSSSGSGKELWEYPNNGSGIATVSGVDGGKQRLDVACPAISEPTDDNPDGCTTADDHWHDADQIVAPGDINGDGAPDLLVKEGTLLYAYYGDRGSKRLDVHGDPVLVGGSDWNHFTVVAPGDLNGDGLPDLLLRDTTTGGLFRSLGRTGEQPGVVDPATWGDPAQRVKVGGGLTASYAVLGAGDLNGDGKPDLWARKADNTMVGWFGTYTGGALSAYGTQFSIDGVVGGTRVPAGTSLSTGASFTSRSAKLTMQSDGNLVITNNSGTSVWSTHTGGNPGATARMQADGNLVVCAADGSTTLWTSNTPQPGGYALLQDRGNLVVYNVKGQSLWSSGSAARHDYNGDGLSDVADWYDYADGHDAVHTFASATSASQVKLSAPVTGVSLPAGNWWAPGARYTTGDFNGDGIGDVSALYGYDDGSVKLFTLLGDGAGKFGAATPSWTAVPGKWDYTRSHFQSGDFNGDGRDDLAAWYDYPDGHDSLWTFTANVQGGFNAPFLAWTSPAGNWWITGGKFVTGDFNGDGRDDITVLYNYDDSHVTLWNFAATPTGAFQAPKNGWSGANGGEHQLLRFGPFDSIVVQAGDFNGDGKDDVVLRGLVRGVQLFTFTSASDGSGTFGEPVSDAVASEDVPNQSVAGDFNGDGIDDLAALNDDGSGGVYTSVLTGSATRPGVFLSQPQGWASTAGSWSLARTNVLNTHS
ncbi:FG-GAP-like repeat-containing protein [Streptomyces sp. NPDC021020]|uniref:FG-GAP-like repeat-containing protein n=1 Tax=Streptomyces sp. NPDC021020 TaxID=3365109 RepID=UPI00378BF5B4